MHNNMNTLYVGDCLKVLEDLPENSVDVVFADPPYNLQLRQKIKRPEGGIILGVENDWAKFSSFEEYDRFTESWLRLCRRVLKENGTLWVTGTYHNIYRIGKILQDLNYWVLNDIIWHKNNPMPNFRGVRFTNATETLIWAAKHKNSKYTFNYHAMKSMNNGKQMQNVWRIPICSGHQRLKTSDGKKAHPTQKPEALLERVLLASTAPGDVILDPFFWYWHNRCCCATPWT